MEKTQLPKEKKENRKKLVLVIGIVLIFLFGILLGLVLKPDPSSPSSLTSRVSNILNPASKQQANQPSNLTGQQANQTPQTPARQAPSVYFETYKNNAISPNIASSITVYTLKDSFSSGEVKALASKLGITTFEVDTPDYAAAYNLTDLDKKGILVFYKATGTFNYKSYSGVKPASYTQGQSVSQEALSYLSDLGLPTQYLSCPITYQRKPMTTLTLVECHYDWTKIGLPYLNLIGLLNVPAETALGSLKLGGITSDSPVDSSIVNINTGDNGKARPNDFNTVTVAIQEGGIIREVSSNIRWIDNQQTVNSASVYTPEEALGQFLSHNAKLSLTIPAGEGGFSYQNIYQNDKAEAKEAVITDYVLSYLEKPLSFSQKYLAPFYTIRGTAVLTTGYRVRFVQTVPALKDTSYSVDFISANTSSKPNNTIASTLNNLNLKQLLTLINPRVYAQSKDETVHSNLQLKTFTLPTSTPFPGQKGSSGSSDELASDATNTQCTNSGSWIAVNTFKLNIPGYGEATLLQNNGHTFYYGSGAVPPSKLDRVKDALFQQIQEQYVINVAKHLTSDSQGFITKSSTVDDVKASFPKINQTGVTPCFEYIFIDHPAPVYGCNDTFGGVPFQKDRAEQVANNVAQEIYNAVQQNQLELLASKPDIFPQYTISDLEWVFEYEPIPDIVGTNNSCYISGQTPSLFLYSPKNQNVSITLPTFLTYTDPATTNGNIWNVTALPNGTTQTTNGLTFPFLYYEYNKAKVTFANPQTGFSIPYGQWETTVRNNIAAKLGLTKAETDQLVIEVKNVLFQLPKANYLTLSLVPEDEINAKLPLSINPQPDTIHRILILITSSEKLVTISTPVLTPLSRAGFTAIELGARGK